MESLCWGAFFVFFLGTAVVITSPISLGIGAITYSIGKKDQNRFLRAALVVLLATVFILLLACIALWIITKNWRAL